MYLTSGNFMILDNDGDTTEVQGSGSKLYTLKNVGGVLSCNCMAWRNQSAKIDLRTCKHLKKVRGVAAEEARIKGIQSPTPIMVDIPFEKLHQPSQIGMGVQILDLNRQSYDNEVERLMTASIRLSEDTCMAAQHLADGTKLRGDEKAKLYGPPVKLANSVADIKDFDPTGWWASEKLDGVRAYWNGKNFISRQGNVYQAPAWFTKGLPDHALDGELWMGRQMFQETISVVKSAASGDRWKAVKFIVFDHPSHSGNFEARQVYLRNLLCDNPYMQIHTQVQICSREEYEHMLQAVVSAGGEGLILVKPGSAYEVGRTSSILKAKLFIDAEGTVIGYEPGKKQFKGLVGGLIVSWQGKEFNVGSGLTINDRKNPPPIGSTITFQYTELTNAGKPKCASFVAIRDYE